MTDYRNILRLHSQGHSQRELERELHCSRHTISAVLVQSAAAGITWPLEDGVTNEDIQEIMPMNLPLGPIPLVQIQRKPFSASSPADVKRSRASNPAQA